MAVSFFATAYISTGFDRTVLCQTPPSGIYKGSNIYSEMSMEVRHTLLFRTSRKTRTTTRRRTKHKARKKNSTIVATNRRKFRIRSVVKKEELGHTNIAAFWDVTPCSLPGSCQLTTNVDRNLAKHMASHFRRQ